MSTLDTTVMIAIHDALRRDLEQIARRAADPNGHLDAALGWELFGRYLDIHHRAEDDLLWPMLQQVLEDRPDDLALVAALEDEHQQIDPLIDRDQLPCFTAVPTSGSSTSSTPCTPAFASTCDTRSRRDCH